jgi:hypothetical protein
MEPDMMRMAQQANIRAVGVEAVRMQAALRAQEIILEYEVWQQNIEGNDELPDPDTVAVRAVAHADALVRRLSQPR